jgi:hypothetical protein
MLTPVAVVIKVRIASNAASLVVRPGVLKKWRRAAVKACDVGAGAGAGGGAGPVCAGCR